jgi:hypothetical protein
MKTRTLLILAIAVAAIMVAAPAAFAHRLASKAERAAMLYHPGNRSGSPGPVGEPQRFPARCAYAVIATVVKGSRWGGYAFNANASHCARFGFDGVTIENRSHGEWFVLWEGSSGTPSNVPTAVFNDISKGLEAAF